MARDGYLPSVLVQIEVLSGPQGGGKSKVMREEAIAGAGRYLFALPTIDLIEEQQRDFLKAAPWLRIHCIHSGQRGTKGSTGKRLTEVRLAIEEQNIAHCVVFTTHATLMDHSLEGFDGWHARLDEAPASVQAGQFTVMSLRHWLNETFGLVGGPGYDWSAISLKTACPDWKDIERDTGAGPLAEFVKQTKQPDRVFVRARSWDDTDDIDWFSMWTPLALSHFASVQIAGSSYTDSVGFKAAKSLFEDKLGVVIREIAPQRQEQPSISIYFFTQGHQGTTALWEKHEGLRLLASVQDYLVEHLPSSAFWSGNKIVETVMFGRMQAQFIQPMAAGLNKHRDATACAFIFSAKARTEDKPLMAVFGLTEDDIRRAREDDAVAQFVMRGAIRNQDYGGSYSIYLYSRDQAERLKHHLHKIAFTKVDLIGLDGAGIMESKPNKVKAERTPEEKAAQIKAAQEKDANRQKNKRDKIAIAEGREPPPKGSRGGRRTGSKDKRRRASRKRA